MVSELTEISAISKGKALQGILDLLADLLFEEWKNEERAGDHDGEPVDEGGA